MLMLFRAVCGFFAVVAVTAADWPQFLGPTSNNHSAETHIVDSIPTNGPPAIFDLPIGTGYAAPSIAAGKLILFHRKGGEEIVEARALDSGKIFWAHASPTSFQDPYGYNNGPRCAPLVADQRIFTFGADGRLTCLDFTTGSPVWQRETAKEFEIPEAFFGVGSTPILEGGKLIVMLGGQPDAGVVALDPATGHTLWQAVGEKTWQGQPMRGWPGEAPVQWKRWEKQASYASPVATTLNGERLLLCLMRQGLVAVNPQDGAARFSRWFRARVDESVNAANPVVRGSEVLISSAYYRTGSLLLRPGLGNTNVTEVWSGLGLEMHWSTPILVGDYLYGFSGRNEPDARLRCVEFATGKVAWERDERWEKYSSKQPAAFGRGSFISVDGKLIALGEGGLLGLFRPNPRQCEEIGRWQVPSLHYPCWAGPVLADGRLYLRSEDRLVALDLRRRE